MAAEQRTRERLHAHYVIERGLGDRLRRSTKDERNELYRVVYNELFRHVPDHPQLTRKASAAEQQASVANLLRIIRPVLRPASTFVEVGAGDCSLSVRVAALVRQVIAIDVSDEITSRVAFPANMRLVISDGSSVPLPAGSVDVMFSHQVIEHMHVDDAKEHVANAARALAPGGVYIVITPHAASGPHDISRYFDSVASGLHMKEYSNGELAALFRAAGFSRVRHAIGIKGRYLHAQPWMVQPVEQALQLLPHARARALALATPLRQILGICLFAYR
jgi:SAM-dependent methyltransferase